MKLEPANLTLDRQNRRIKVDMHDEVMPKKNFKLEIGYKLQQGRIRFEAGKIVSSKKQVDSKNFRVKSKGNWLLVSWFDNF